MSGDRASSTTRAPGPPAPLVSVLIATYNWSGVLRHAIESVLRQTYADFELLVTGDGCTDDSEAVVAAFADSRVSWRNLAQNRGSQSHCHNAALDHARGRYIAYLGHDDLWRADHLRLLVDAAERDHADVLFTLAVMIHPASRWISGLAGVEGLDSGAAIVPSSVLHRREVFDRIGPWSDPRAIVDPVDADFFRRARRAGLRFQAVDALTVFKFTSSMRPNCYVERPCHEQAEYARRMRDEPDFVEREWLALARDGLHGPIRVARWPTPPANAPPGFLFDQLQQVRGLAPLAPAMPPLAADLDDKLQVTLLDCPRAVPADGLFEVEVAVRNDADVTLRSAPPYPVHLSYHWFDAAGQIEVFDGLRSVLLAPIASGERADARVSVRAPLAPGRRRLQIALVQEDQRWIEGPAGCMADVLIERSV